MLRIECCKGAFSTSPTTHSIVVGNFYLFNLTCFRPTNRWPDAIMAATTARTLDDAWHSRHALACTVLLLYCCCTITVLLLYCYCTATVLRRRTLVTWLPAHTMAMTVASSLSAACYCTVTALLLHYYCVVTVLLLLLYCGGAPW